MALQTNRLPRTAQEIAANELRDAIVRGELAPGSKIRQEATARDLGISVIPVREALKSLAGEGFLTYEPQRGYFVAELTASSLGRLARARDLIEGAAEEDAVPRVSSPQIAQLRVAMAEHEHALAGSDSVAIVVANRRFHWLILEPSDNEYLLRFVRQLWDALEPYRGLVYRRADLATARSELMPDIVAEHRAIVDALAAGDQRNALVHLRRHRQRSDEILRRFVAA